MKKTGIFAVLIAAVLTTAAFAGCSDRNDSSSGSSVRPRRTESIPSETEPVGTNVIKGELGKEIVDKDTAFTLNSVVSALNSDTGEHFIYMDITLRNSMAKEYALSTLNNFYIELPDGNEVYSDVRTQLYARQHFNESKYYTDPFNIPSNGQFSGLIGGIVLVGDIKDFKLCFYPTGDDERAKGTVIKYDITPSDIIDPPAEVLK